MNEQQAIALAEAHLREQRCHHIGIRSARRLPYLRLDTGERVEEEQRYFWSVIFAVEVPPDVVSTADSLIVIVDEASGAADIEPTL